MQMPRNKFDTHAACARMDADTTLHHRERWPSLAFVWDELDDLRAESQTAVDSEDHASVEKELQEALDELDEMRLALKTVLGALDDLDAVRSAAETVMMGEGA
jgi:hypothetical protein